MSETKAVLAFVGMTEAPLSVGHRTYSGTVATTTQQAGPVESFTSVSAAALSLGHRTYSGTVASTERVP